MRRKSFDVNAATASDDAWVWNQNAGMMDVPVRAMPNEYEDVLQPNNGCKNVESTVYKQDAAFDGRWFSRRDNPDHGLRVGEKLIGMSQLAAEADASARRVSKGRRPYSPTTRGGVVEMAYDVGVTSGYVTVMTVTLVSSLLVLVGIVAVCVWTGGMHTCGTKRGASKGST